MFLLSVSLRHERISIDRLVTYTKKEVELRGWDELDVIFSAVMLT